MKKYSSQLCKLGDIGTVARGKSKHRPRNAPSLYGGKYPFIQTSDVKHSNFYITHYSQTYNEKGFAQSKLWQPGTLCITIAANIADTAILKIPACFPDSIIGFIPHKQKADVRFIKYCLDTYKLQIQSISRGTTQDNLSLEKLLSINFNVPPLPIQKKIAAILSAYDDLIENNNRRIAILEKMAEEIYREWFVRMRFPGHKKTKFHKGLPEDWIIRPFSKVVIINPDLKIDKFEMLPYVGMEDLSINSIVFKHKEFRKGHSGSKFQNDDVLFPRITPSLENGKRGYVMNLKDKEVGLGSTEFIVFRNKILQSDYIYFLTCSLEFRKHAELSMRGASGRQRVQEDCFDFFLIKTPPKDLLLSFSAIVKPLFSQIKNIFNSNILIKKSRDLLLNRLISGKLSVENLDIKFPPIMEEEDA
jgi:type I restriction enzyme S subunit